MKEGFSHKYIIFILKEFHANEVNMQRQADEWGWDAEHPGLEEDVPACCGVLGTR